MHRRCWYMNLSALLILAIFSGSVSARCDRTPENNPYPRTSADDRFHIQISGNPETYVPGEQYTVFLRGTINTLEQHKFKDFLLVIEPEQQELAGHAVRGPGIIPSVGHFTLLGDALTKFSDVCPNAVSQTNSLPKTEIQVFWKAPPSGSGCVAFRATVLEQRDLWYMDEGDLTRILCEEVTETDDTQPPVLGKCCACDEAKYEVTFEGLWSRNTHPKDFPSNGWLTRFSDVIGASHTRNYTFWNYGEYASEGLRQVAENGNTRMLESELKGKSDHIRTIIKARGISYPNVTGKTFAVFRVDNQHHLMSLVSMIDPSPDWFVGVSSLELCLRNCSWIESKILNLYPWDAGTDDGWTYISPDQPSTPRSPIRRIKSNSPNDPRSPFYDPTGAEMKPLARLYLSRQRLYEKPCDSVDPDPDPQDDCEVTEWSVWSPCSATCGRGTKYRQRKYVRDSSKYHCTKHLTSRASCWGPQRACPDHSEDRLNDPMCALTDWSEWSSCSVTCGRGVRTRDRRYMTRNATKHCTHGIRNLPKLKDTEKCWGEGPCSQEENGPEIDEIPDCPSRPWSDWSPCSATCGQGSKMRLRDPVNTESNYEDDDEENASAGDDEEDPCEDERDKEVVVCQAEIPTCDIYSGSAEDVCRLPKDVGPCRANIQRWFFDVVRAKCDVFSFSGCQGNRNNFDTQDYCEKVCGQFKKELVANRTEQKNKLGVSVSGVLSYNLQLQDDANIVTRDPINDYEVGGFIANSQLNGDHTYVTVTPSVIHCKTSPWSSWGPCNATKSCGKGFKHRHREILVHPMNGGQACPKKLLRTKKCRIPCKNKDKTNTNYEKYNIDENEESWMDLNPVWGSPSLSSEISQDCVMSKWSPWSPCSVTCGTMAVQQRTRRILQHPRGGGQPCMSRVDTKACPVLPCHYT